MASFIMQTFIQGCLIPSAWLVSKFLTGGGGENRIADSKVTDIFGGMPGTIVSGEII